MTVYLDDDEAADIWHKDIGLSLKQIQRLDENENFWPASAPSLGPDGVCGPCSEIFFHPDDGPECEIWNLVFTQFNREGAPPENLTPLPNKNIDTGMGLERTAATLQGASTNFHIDTLMPIVEAAAEVCGVKYDADSDNGRRLRRITDHVRACSLAIHENVYPGNKGAESVIRLLLRRATLQGYDMGLRDPFLYQLVPSVVEQLGKPYPELRETVERVASVIQAEENSFYSVIEKGIPRVEKIAKQSLESGRKELDMEMFFDAYQTHGVPSSIGESVAEQNGLTFDWVAFDELKDKHAIISNETETIVMGDAGPLDVIKREVKSTTFVGYEALETSTDVRGMYSEHVEVVQEKDSESGKSKDKNVTVQLRLESLEPCDRDLFVVVSDSPFYAESGGQVGDAGWIVGPNGKFEVLDTQKNGDVIIHRGRVSEGSLAVGDSVQAKVDADRRKGICRAHSATHILHYALQQNLGQHAQQRGSKVSEDHLRFDFSNMDPITSEQLASIEHQTIEKIESAQPIKAETLPLEAAREQGAMMLFGEKYPDPVRMVSIGEFSKELCGGTHLENSSEVVCFEISSEENMGSGTRRIQAWTGQRAKNNQQKILDDATAVAGQLNTVVPAIPNAVEQLTKSVKDLKKQLSAGRKSSADSEETCNTKIAEKEELTYFEVRTYMREAAAILNVPLLEVRDRIGSMVNEISTLEDQLEKLSAAGDVDANELIESAVMAGDVRIVARELPGANRGLMVQLIDQVRKKTNPVAILFATSPGEGEVLLSAGLSRDLVEKGFNAGAWIREVALVVDGKGGGKPDLAQAGGKNPDKISDALTTAIEFMKVKQSG